ncbi:MAG: hypothetical protein ABA06_02210 [Parcubacteria bacterium C7867-001]|nr:MAG: hypothetical protein ABA06_02210 [Parcubacteria bacterium C7867-001]
MDQDPPLPRSRRQRPGTPDASASSTTEGDGVKVEKGKSQRSAPKEKKPPRNRARSESATSAAGASAEEDDESFLEGLDGDPAGQPALRAVSEEEKAARFEEAMRNIPTLGDVVPAAPPEQSVTPERSESQGKEMPSPLLKLTALEANSMLDTYPPKEMKKYNGAKDVFTNCRDMYFEHLGNKDHDPETMEDLRDMYVDARDQLVGEIQKLGKHIGIPPKELAEEIYSPFYVDEASEAIKLGAHIESIVKIRRTPSEVIADAMWRRRTPEEEAASKLRERSMAELAKAASLVGSRDEDLPPEEVAAPVAEKAPAETVAEKDGTPAPDALTEAAPAPKPSEAPAIVAPAEAKKEEKLMIAKPKTVSELLERYFMGTMKGRELSNFGVLDDVFFAARQAYADAPNDPARKAAYLEAKEDLLHAMGNNVDQNTHDKAGIITDANQKNPISMKDIRALFDAEEKALLGKSAEQGEGKEAVSGMLKELLGKNQEAVAFLFKSYQTARGDYRDILVDKIAEAQKKGKDLRLDRKAMNMRENYVEARNSLLHALTNLMRPGAGFIKKGEGEDRLREVALTKILNAFSTEETAHDLTRDTSFDPVAGLLRDSFLVKEVGPVAEKVLASRATEDSREMLSHMLRPATNDLAPLFEGRSDASRTEYEEARLDYLTFAETEAQVSTMNIKYYDKEGRFEERPQKLFPFFPAKDPYKEGRKKTSVRYDAALKALKKLYSDRRHLGAFRDKRDIDGRIGTALRNIERLDGQLVNRIHRGRFSNQLPGWIRVGKGRGGR